MIDINSGKNAINLFVLPKIISYNSFGEVYDFIIFDTPPSSNQITQSAFLYADRLLIPTIMDRVSEIGVKHYWNKINKIYEKYCSTINKDYSYFKYAFGEEIIPLGVFETMCQGVIPNIEDAVRDNLRSMFKNEFKIYNSKIKELNDVLIYVYDLNLIYNINIIIGEGVGRNVDTRDIVNCTKKLKGYKMNSDIDNKQKSNYIYTKFNDFVAVEKNIYVKNGIKFTKNNVANKFSALKNEEK